MGRTACTEPQCLYRGALYLPLPYYLNTFHLWNVLLCCPLHCAPGCWGGGLRKGARGPHVLHMFLPLSLVPLFADCTNKTFSPNPSHSAADTISDLVYRFLSGPPFLGVPKKILYRARTRSRRPCLYPPRITRVHFGRKLGSMYSGVPVDAGFVC